MNKKRTALFSTALLGVILLLMSVGSYAYIQRAINTPLSKKKVEKREFTIREGENVGQIAYNLEKERLINGKDYFRIYVWQRGLAGRLQAGNYELSPSMTIPEIVELFVSGKVKSDEISVTIPEGFSNKEIDERLAKNGLIKKGEFLNFDKNITLDLSKYDFLKDKPNNVGLQGYYFPDTYVYHKGSSVEEITKKMLDNFDRRLSNSLREEIRRQGKSIFEVVILASIVEKEAKYPEDMKMIAGIFQNRLKMGKPLESDATINYITGSGRSQSTYEDIQIDSPYNTYKYPGLPPGPISNPGLEAIKAVVYPAKTDYLYFLTKKDGKAVFSKTYEEHLRNKKKYLQ